MASRSLKLSAQGKQQVERVLIDKAWGNDELIDTVGVQIATVKKFRAGKAVDRKNFVNFCRVLGLDWEQVARLESYPTTDSEPTKFSESGGTTAENLQENLNESQGVQVQGSDTTIVGQTVNVYQGAGQDTATGVSTGSAQIDEQRIRQLCRETILQNYSKIRLLSGQEIGVDQLYVDVWLLDRQPRTFQRSASKMLETFDLREDRLGLGRRIQRDSGLKVAEEQPKLLILGKPGAGKTTFLKHLAVNWCKEEFKPYLIAIFIEFRKIRSLDWDLLNVIRDKLQIPDKHIKFLLNHGQFLILMDGFDEIPNENIRYKVHEHLSDFTELYSKNRYIVTSRTQVIQGLPAGFTAVEVADFKDEQVKDFFCKWFHVVDPNEHQCEARWNKFKFAIDQNRSLKELTVTPVLLGLMCLVVHDDDEIPLQAGFLYERGIRLLLSRWNDEKAIENWKIGPDVYQNLSVEAKERLLIEIAAKKFDNPENFVLFEQNDLLSQITQFLGLPSYSHAQYVLRSIEAQHGLLVERADELWSFSHLTFQEYFTSKWLMSLPSKEFELKAANSRWQEVVRQIFKSQRHSKNLICLIEKAVNDSISGDPRIKQFLCWVESESSVLNLPYDLPAVRAFCCAFLIEKCLVQGIIPCSL